MSIPTADELAIRYASGIKGKVVLTTGVSPGSLGAYFVQAIAKSDPALIILAGRDQKKAQETDAAIKASNPSVKTRFLQLDLSSMQAVREAAAVVNGWSDVPVIDVLVNNAFHWPDKYRVTTDGFEMQFATNYLGPFLFTNLIMEKVLASSAPRIVNVSSQAHVVSPIRFGDYNLDGGEPYSRLVAYAQSKTGNMLFSISLAEKLGRRGLLSFSLHPGTIMTNTAPNLDFKAMAEEFRQLARLYGDKEGFIKDNIVSSPPDLYTVAQGTATHVYASFDPEIAAHNGSYLVQCRVADPLTYPVKPWANSRFEAEKLWRLSEELLGQKFSY